MIAALARAWKHGSAEKTENVRAIVQTLANSATLFRQSYLGHPSNRALLRKSRCPPKVASQNIPIGGNGCIVYTPRETVSM